MRKNIKEILARQEILNKKLATFFKENGITNFRLTSLGNSIATGYSAVRTIRPLLLRNESIKQILEENNITLDRHHFARAQNNNDEHIYEWLTTNIKESEINRMNRADYEKQSKIHMTSPGITKEQIEEYYPLEQTEDLGLKDTILELNENLANVVIYNGATGSFLDNLTRKGKLSNQLIHGVKRDITSIEATLKEIQTNNRKNNTNTQVYLCGAPNFLGLNITGIINRKLKKLADEYANVTYVKPVISKLLYKEYNIDELKTIEEAQSIIKKIKFPKPDIHYDEIEYLKFNNNIIESLINNYQINSSLIFIDRELYKLSSYLEIENNSPINNPDYVNEMITNIISSQYTKFTAKEQRNIFMSRVKKYLTNRVPYDFHYVRKNNIQDSINSIQKKH